MDKIIVSRIRTYNSDCLSVGDGGSGGENSGVERAGSLRDSEAGEKRAGKPGEIKKDRISEQLNFKPHSIIATETLMP